MLQFQKTKCAICFVIKNNQSIFLNPNNPHGSHYLLAGAGSQTVIYLFPPCYQAQYAQRSGWPFTLSPSMLKFYIRKSFDSSRSRWYGNTYVCLFEAEVTVNSLLCVQTEHRGVIKVTSISASIEPSPFLIDYTSLLWSKLKRKVIMR